MNETPHISNLQGLNESQIKVLRVEYGKNIFNEQKPHKILHSLWNVVKEPMFLMLVFACFLYFFLGEAREGLMMVVAMFFVAGISFYQEVKSSKALAALRKIIEPRVQVVREGKETTILSEDLLPGDVMLLEEGNRVPADAIVLEQNDMTVNESVITGESFPVEKSTSDGLLFQGSALNSGKCYARVTAIGNSTVLGKLGKFILSIPPSKTVLQAQIERFVKVMAITGLFFFLLILGANYFHNGNVIVSLLFGLTMAMSIVP